MPALRILLADDNDHVLSCLTSLLAANYEIVGTVNDGQSLIEHSQRLKPDVLLVDISMPIKSGIEAVRELKTAGSNAKVLFITAHEDQEYVEAAFAAGADGFVIKNRLAIDLLPALNEVIAGRRFVSTAVDRGGDTTV